MILEAILQGIEADFSASDRATEIAGISCQPRVIRPGFIFANCQVPWLEGGKAIEEALAAGAVAIMVDRESHTPFEVPPGVTLVRVDNVNRAYALACGNYYSNAHRQLRLYGVTGTKGKTTTCHLIESALRHYGFQTGLISTLVRRYAQSACLSSVTTPEPAELHRLLCSMQRQGVTHVVIEVSSAALAEGRLDGLQFDGVVFTNLGNDHLSYHREIAAYVAAKRRLFCDPNLHSADGTLCVVNADDATGAKFADEALGQVVTYGLASGDVRPTSFEVTETESYLQIGEKQLRTRLGGVHNVYNILAAFTLVRHVIASSDEAIFALSDASPLPGRLERLPTGTDLDVFIDYAHTPESVYTVLDGFGKYRGVRKRVVVIGCGGGTDQNKRSLMTQAALAGSDLTVITTDNPRWDDPFAIIREMVAGLDFETLVRDRRLCIVPDRRKAIEAAINAAAPSGVVIILGKGHERTQVTSGRAVAFADREVAWSVLARSSLREADMVGRA